MEKDLDPDVGKSSQPKGAAMPPPNMDPFGEERAASMADEGGRSAAVVERQQPLPRARPAPRTTARKILIGIGLGIGVLATLAGGFALYRTLRS